MSTDRSWFVSRASGIRTKLRNQYCTILDNGVFEMCIANNAFRSIGSSAGVLGWFGVYDGDRNRKVLHTKLRNEYYTYSMDDTFFVATIVIG